MANNKRGHRRGKKKDPADTPEANTDPSTNESFDSSSALHKVQSSDTVPPDDHIKSSNHPQSTDNFQSTCYVQSTGPGQSAKAFQTSHAVPTTSMVQPSAGLQSTDGVQPTKIVQVAAESSNQASEPIGLPCTACGLHGDQLKQANQRIAELEADVYRLEQSREQSKKYQKRARAEDVAKIKELEKQVNHLDEALGIEKERNVTLEKQAEVQRSDIVTRMTKQKESDACLAKTCLELQKVHNDIKSVNDQVRWYREECEKLREYNAMLTANHCKREDSDATSTTAANTLMSEQYDGQDDAAKRDTLLQKQKAELEDMTRRYKELVLSRNRDVGSEDGSDAGPRPRSRKRHQQARPLSHELEGMLSDGDIESIDGSRFSQALSQGLLATTGQPLPKENPQSLFPNPYSYHGGATEVPSMPFQRPQSMPSFPLALNLDPKMLKTFEYQAETIRRPSNAAAQANQLAPQVKAIECQIGKNGPSKEVSTQTDMPTPDTASRYKQQDVSTQTDMPIPTTVNHHKQEDVSTQTDMPTPDTASCYKQQDVSTQTDMPIPTTVNHHKQEDVSTQTDISIDDLVHHHNQKEGSTQTDKPTNAIGNHDNQKDASTQTKESSSPAQVAIRTSSPAKVSLLRRLGYEHWFFIIAACILLLFAAFTFYHGLQARAERAMWLAANDYTRRAVIYHRNASMRGQWVGWLTTAKMRDLGVGYGSGFGKYGVEIMSCATKGAIESNHDMPLFYGTSRATKEAIESDWSMRPFTGMSCATKGSDREQPKYAAALRDKPCYYGSDRKRPEYALIFQDELCY